MSFKGGLADFRVTGSARCYLSRKLKLIWRPSISIGTSIPGIWMGIVLSDHWFVFYPGACRNRRSKIPVEYPPGNLHFSGFAIAREKTCWLSLSSVTCFFTSSKDPSRRVKGGIWRRHRGKTLLLYSMEYERLLRAYSTTSIGSISTWNAVHHALQLRW